MKRKSVFLVIAIVAVLALVGCSGKKEASGGSAESGNQSVSVGGNDSLYDIPRENIKFTDSLQSSKDTVLDEIPAELFKGIGRIRDVDVMKYPFGDFKYSVVLSFYVESGENASKKLFDHYRSIGGTVEEKGDNRYSVVFDWGESVEFYFRSSSAGGDYIQSQFSVVKN